MTTTMRDAGPFEKVLSVHVSSEDLESGMDRAARRLSQELKIKGFRPGRAPRQVVEATVGTDRLRSEAIDEALPRLVTDALSETNIAPAVPPAVESFEEADDGYDVEVKVTVWPTLEVVPPYEGREFTVTSPEVSEEELSTQIDRMRDQFAELEVVPRPAQQSDFVAVNLSATHDGTPVDEVNASDLLYELGSQSFIEGLDEELTGRSAGEIVQFRAPLPEGFGELAGQRVSVQALVKEVREKRLPDLTDEWASDVTEFSTVEELRTELSAQLGKVKLGAVADEYRTTALETLIGEMEVEIPDAIVGAEMDATLHRFAHQLASQDIELGDYLEATGLSQDEFLTDLRRQAELTTKTDILLDAIASDAGIEVTDSEFEEVASALAAQAEEDETSFVDRLRGTAQEIAVRSDILRRKALQALLESAVPIDHNGSPIDFSSSPDDQAESPPTSAIEVNE